MKKRILSVLLALCMCLTFVPVSVFAEDLQQDNSISVLSITPDEGTYYTYVFTVDGKEINRQIVKNGDTLLEPKVPAQDGKVFTGWDKTVPFGVIDGLAGDNQTITVNAQFKDGYHVYFKDNNGRIIATKTVENGTKVTFEDVKFPVGSDEAITGWYKDADRTKKVDSVTINGADITLYAKVEKGHWITFESNGGSYVEPKFFVTSANTKEPTDPTKPGYAFAGWYNGKDQYTFGNALTENIELKAHWTAQDGVKYTVIHWLENADDNGYSYKESETKTGTTGGTTRATANSYTGFTAQTITQETIKGDGSTIVSVKYTRNVYEVTFYLDDPIYNCGKEKHTHWWPGCYDWRGNLDCGKEAHTHSSACGKIETIVIEAKHGANISDQWPTVNGSSTWRTSKNGNTYQANIDTMPLGGTNFYGPKTGNRYETAYYYVEVLPGEAGIDHGGVDYKLHHKDTSPGQGYSVTKEDKYAITGFTYKDGTRDGGNYDGAKFYYTRNSYDIVFVNNGAKEKTASRKFEQSIADVNYTPTAPVGKEGYVFDGWYDNELGEGTAYVFDGKTMPAQNITLYAKWVAPTYTVTVYDVDGSVHYTFNKVAKNSTISSDVIPDLKLAEGETFLGWVQKDGTPFSFSTKINQNYDLYAKVGNNSRYTVTYHSNTTPDATVTDDTMIYAKDVLATVNDNSFTNGDKVFLSWNTRADGKGETYYPNGTIKVTGNMDLYARWGDKASTVSVTYHSNFGTDVAQSAAAVANNSKITVEAYNALNLPERTGYSFVGWNTEADGTGRTFAAGAFARVDVTEPNDLYAQWTPNTDTTYKVEFYYQNDDGSYPSTASKTEPRTGTTDTTVSVTNADKEAKEDGKYVYDTTAANVESGKVAADGSLVLKLYFKLNQFQLTIHYVYAEGGKASDDYAASVTFGNPYSVNSPVIDGYTADTTVVSGTMPAENVEVTVIYTKRTDLSYTVHYYWNGTTESVAPDKTVPGQSFNASVTESPVAVTGCTPVNEDSKAITIGTGKNEIIFYYYKNVELTANSKTETYDGTEKSVSGFTSKVALDSSDVTLTFTPAITVGAKGTNVGTYPASFAEGTVGTVDTTEKYIVTKATPGKLTIKPAEVTVTIKGNTKTETYAGTEYTVTGYTVESISNNLYKEEYFALKTDAKVEAKGTNAGDYMMGLTAGSFANSNTNFEVTFVVEDGKLTIAKRDVTVTGESATKVYNGQTQEINGYTVDNLVKGHEMTGVTYSAKGKDPGKYDGSFIDDHKIVDASVEDVTANYNVKTVIGALTITQPSRPTRPSTPTKDVTSVKTADGSQMTLWMSMMLASAAGIVFLGKKRKEEQ